MSRPPHTLVIVFLRGGADGLSIVPPVGLDAYHRARPTLRVRPEETIAIDERFGLPLELTALERHLSEGRLAIVHGAGSADTTRSHFEAQDFMEHGGGPGGGWLARALRAGAPRPSALGAVAIGAVQPESLRGAPGAAVMRSIDDFAIDPADEALVASIASLYVAERGPLADAARDTMETIARLRELRLAPGRPAGGADYPDTSFGRGLREVVRLVKAEVGTRVATIDMVGGGLGWDTHFVQGQAMPELLRELGRGLDAFWRDLDDHRDRVTLVAMTEFGRRVRENSSLGTDHGAGSIMLVMGEGLGALPAVGASEAITPGAVFSAWRDLDEGSLVGAGDVPVTTDYRAVLAPLLRRADPAIDLEAVFPGLAWA